MESFPHRLYLVTDQKACLGRDFFWILEEALQGGVDLVQIREKELNEKEFIEKAQKTKVICDRYQVPLIVNDQWKVAKACEAFAVHIGQEDDSFRTIQRGLGEHYPFGLSVEMESDLHREDSLKAWYLGVSPIFSTPTKEDTRSEWGLEGLKKVREQCDQALVAIGQVRLDNARAVLEHGADCLAVVSGICSADQPGKAAEAYRKIIDAYF